MKEQGQAAHHTLACNVKVKNRCSCPICLLACAFIKNMDKYIFLVCVCVCGTLFKNVLLISQCFRYNQPGKVVAVHTREAYRGRRGIGSLILNLSIRWRCGQLHAVATLLPYHSG